MYLIHHQLIHSRMTAVRDQPMRRLIAHGRFGRIILVMTLCFSTDLGAAGPDYLTFERDGVPTEADKLVGPIDAMLQEAEPV